MQRQVLGAFLLTVAGVSMAAAVGHAQLRRPTATVAALVESEGLHPGEPSRVALQVTLPEGLHVQSNAPKDPTLLPTVLTIDPPPGVAIREIVYPASVELRQAGLEQPLSVFGRGFTIGVALTIAATVPPGDLVIPAHLRYQACDEQMCYAPATVDTQWTVRVVSSGTPIVLRHREVFDGIAFGHGAAPTQKAPRGSVVSARVTDDGGLAMLDNFAVLATSGGYLGKDEFLGFIHDAERGVRAKGLFEDRGPLAILLIVFLGGLALNLTPCVLPMIPINLAIIGAGAHAGSRSRGLALGTAYGSAMALVYGVLGLVVILTAGTFGTINASPWFNAAIAVVFVVLGLAMFDVVPIDFSRFSGGLRPGEASRGSLGLAFTMGAVAALLAGACVAPVVIQVVLFSSNLYATGTKIALALPFVLGIGMAIPWPIAGAGIAALPKPGAWMVRIKQVFGVLILGTAIYYGYLAYSLFSNRWVEPSAVTSSVEEKLKAGWHAALSDGLAVAQREQKPVLIDIWATWCKNCLTMDKTTLEEPAVTAALSGYVKIKFQAEDPDRQPAKAVMQRFKAVGLPAYVILRPNRSTPTS